MVVVVGVSVVLLETVHREPKPSFLVGVVKKDLLTGVRVKNRTATAHRLTVPLRCVEPVHYPVDTTRAVTEIYATTSREDRETLLNIW